MATVRTDFCRASAISEFDIPSSKAKATIRSTALSERGNAGGGSRKLKTATSSPPTTARDARRPNGTDPDRDGLETRERNMPETVAPCPESANTPCISPNK